MIIFQTPEIVTDKDELVVTTSILSFILWGPKSAVNNENDDNESTLVCHAYNPVIKTFNHHYVETKIILDVQCKLLITYYVEYILYTTKNDVILKFV